MEGRLLFGIGTLFNLGSKRENLIDSLQEAKRVSIAYAKQETLTPLKNLGRYLAFGILGSLFMGIGLVILTLSVLRVLQVETGETFTNHLSWVPYLLTFVLSLIVIALAAWGIQRDAAKIKKRRARDDS